MLSSIEVSDWYRTIIIGRLFWNQCYVFTLVLVKQLPRDSVSLSDCRYDELRLLLMIFIVGCYPLQGILLCPIYIYIYIPQVIVVLTRNVSVQYEVQHKSTVLTFTVENYACKAAMSLCGLCFVSSVHTDGLIIVCHSDLRDYVVNHFSELSLCMLTCKMVRQALNDGWACTCVELEITEKVWSPCLVRQSNPQ